METENREELNLETGCYLESSHGIYNIERLHNLLLSLIPEDAPYAVSDECEDDGAVIRLSLYANWDDIDNTITLTTGQEVTWEDAHEFSSELYDALTDRLPTDDGYLWIWMDGELFYASEDELDENGEWMELD